MYMYCKICKKKNKQKNMKSGIYQVFLLWRVAARKVSFPQDCCICYRIDQCVTDNGYVTDKDIGL